MGQLTTELLPRTTVSTYRDTVAPRSHVVVLYTKKISLQNKYSTTTKKDYDSRRQKKGNAMTYYYSELKLL